MNKRVSITSWLRFVQEATADYWIYKFGNVITPTGHKMFPFSLQSFSPLSLFWKKNRSRLMRSTYCLYVRVYVYPPPHIHFWMLEPNLYKTWYVYHATWGHLNGVLHKSLPRVSIYMCIPYRCYATARQKRCRCSGYTSNNTKMVGRDPRAVLKERRRSVLPRTSSVQNISFSDKYLAR
jgi:hypothetical protein